MAHVIIEVLSEWGVKNCIKALSFDTTSSNTGRKNGVCMLVEMQLWKKVLYLAGRHHIHEILLEEAFSITMGPSTGPDILLVKRYKAFWENIRISNFKPGMEIQSVAAAVLDFQLMSVILHFANLN